MAFPGSFLTDVALGPYASRQAAMDCNRRSDRRQTAQSGVSGFRYESSLPKLARLGGTSSRAAPFLPTPEWQALG